MPKIRTPLKAIKQNCLGCSETRKLVAQCPCDGVDSEWCASWPLRFGIRPKTAVKRYRKYIGNPELMKARAPIKAIREYCISCSLSAKTVAYCPCDGVNSTSCPLWRYRFGLRPESAIRKYGRHVMAPGSLPDSTVCLDDLPANPADWKASPPEQSAADRIPSRNRHVRCGGQAE